VKGEDVRDESMQNERNAGFGSLIGLPGDRNSSAAALMRKKFRGRRNDWEA